MGTPKVFTSPTGVGEKLGGLADQANLINDALNPFNGLEGQRLPFWQTGARALIRVGGRPIGVCQQFSWRVDHQGSPVETIDANAAWDIEPGQTRIQANMKRIMDPTGGPEADGLLPILSAAVHQPYVELQVLDKLGTCLFFARGMFLAVAADVAIGQISTYQASFTGVMYQHYVSQQFKPYESVAGAVQGLVGGLQNLVSTATGGIL